MSTFDVVVDNVVIVVAEAAVVLFLNAGQFLNHNDRTVKITHLPVLSANF